MVTDEELAELMKQAVAEVYPAAGALVTQAEQHGRRLRRRRIAWIAGGNAAAVVAIAALVTTVMQLPASRQAADSASPTPGASPGHTSGSAQPSASPTATPTAPQEPPMTTDHMLTVLRSLLPAGSVLTDARSNIGPGSLEVNYNDGNGTADIMVDITPFSQAVSDAQYQQQGMQGGLSPSTILALSCPDPLWTDEGTRPAGALPISCQVRALPDGSIERDAVMYADGYGFYGYNIYDQRPDHLEVSIQVGNGYFDPYLPHVDRATPPGSMALWEQVVESPLWHA